MADFADDAAEITENYLQVALQNARQQPRQHPFTGICRNCDHPVSESLPVAFCGSCFILCLSYTLNCYVKIALV